MPDGDGAVSDARFMAAAIALSQRGRGRTGANPNVGCIIVKDGVVIGRGWTQPDGRPHAEEMALEQAGKAAKGADIYVTMEPCAHESPRGPTCSDSIVKAGPARVIVAMLDSDERTRRRGIDRLGAAGISVSVGLLEMQARRAMAGFLSRVEKGRPHVTLKLAMSLDGCIAMNDGTSKWITGARARKHGHLERARSDAVLLKRISRGWTCGLMALKTALLCRLFSAMPRTYRTIGVKLLCHLQYQIYPI